METQLLPPIGTSAAPYTTIPMAQEVSLEQELGEVQGVKREYLLLKMLGVDHYTIVRVLGSDDLLKFWKKDKEFSALFKNARELGRKHQKEAINLVRQSSRTTLIVMEQLLTKKLLQEVIDGEPLFIKTHIGREVYNRLMNAIEGDGKNKGTGAWEELILRRGWNYETQQSTDSIVQTEHTPS